MFRLLLCVLYNQAFQNFTYMLCSIGCLFQFVHDFFNLDKFDTIFFFFKEFGDEELIYIIRLVFDFMQFGAIFSEECRLLAECFEFIHSFTNIYSFFLDQTAQFFSAFRNRTRIINGNPFGTTVYSVDDIIHTRS